MAQGTRNITTELQQRTDINDLDQLLMVNPVTKQPMYLEFKDMSFRVFKRNYISTIAEMEAFVRGDIDYVIVTEEGRRGPFRWYSEGSGYIPDGGTVFTAQDGGYWVRDFHGAVVPEWFENVQAAIDSCIESGNGLAFVSQKIYELDQITVDGPIVIRQNNAILKATTINTPFINVTGNDVKWYDIKIESPQTVGSRQLEIIGDNFYSNSVYVDGGFYAVNVRGDKCQIDRLFGINQGYATCRLFSNLKDIEFLNITNLISINSERKGFVHNGEFEVKDINIVNLYHKTNSTELATEGLLIDPALPSGTLNVKNVNITNFYSQGSNSNSLKLQNTENINIVNFVEGPLSSDKVSTYSSVFTLNCNVTINKITALDRLNFFGGKIRINQLDFIKDENLNSPTSLFFMNQSSAYFCDVYIDRANVDENCNPSSNTVFRFDSDASGKIVIGSIKTTLVVANFVNGFYPGCLEILSQSEYADVGLTNATRLLVVRKPRDFILDTKPISGEYIRGDRVFFPSPSLGGNIGEVCLSGGSPGTWSPFGRIGQSFYDNYMQPERILSPFDLNTLTDGFVKYNGGTSSDFINAPYTGFWKVIDFAYPSSASTTTHWQIAYPRTRNQIFSRRYYGETWKRWELISGNRFDEIVTENNHVLLEEYHYKYLRGTSASTGNWTIDPDVFVERDELIGEIEGAERTFIGGIGVTIRTPNGFDPIVVTNGRFRIKFKTANDCLLTGDLQPTP